MSNKDYLKVAAEVVQESGGIFAKYFGHPGKVEIKYADPRNLVTEIDRKIEKLIRVRLGKKFPAHKIVGEELENGKLEKGDLVWYVDPIDGTANFIHGLPFCCISLALWDADGPLIGVVYDPALDLMFTAVRGQGAYCNHKKLNVTTQAQMNRAFGGYGWGRNIQNAGRHFPQLVKYLNKIRTLGTTAMEICMVAKGTYDFHLQAEVNIWDFAAAVLVLQEAGGKVTDWQGKPITANTKRLLVTNGKLHNKFVKVLKGLK